MASLADIRAGIAANIKDALPEVTCTGYALENPYTPAFEVEFAGTVYDAAMGRGLDEWRFTIRGLSSSSVLDQDAQRKLDQWLDGSGGVSIKAALEADRTLGGSASDCRVERVGPIKEFAPKASPGTSYFGAEWTLVVLAGN